jgi:hypothetical protein
VIVLAFDFAAAFFLRNCFRIDRDCAPIFLGECAATYEDNILTLIHELFTGGLRPVKSAISITFAAKKARFADEARRLVCP